jgi:hypothetical protein
MSSDELKEVEIDDGVRAVTNIKKKAFVQKVFGAVAFSKAFPRTEVTGCFEYTFELVGWSQKITNLSPSGSQHSPMLPASARRW